MKQSSFILISPPNLKQTRNSETYSLWILGWLQRLDFTTKCCWGNSYVHHGKYFEFSHPVYCWDIQHWVASEEPELSSKLCWRLRKPMLHPPEGTVPMKWKFINDINDVLSIYCYTHLAVGFLVALSYLVSPKISKGNTLLFHGGKLRFRRVK